MLSIYSIIIMTITYALLSEPMRQRYFYIFLIVHDRSNKYNYDYNDENMIMIILIKNIVMIIVIINIIMIIVIITMITIMIRMIMIIMIMPE